MARTRHSCRPAYCEIAGRESRVQVVGRVSKNGLLYRVEFAKPPFHSWEGTMPHSGAAIEALKFHLKE